jgi:hypothetical protein
MKTDSFNDRIRQKLESIEPTFRERDWGQLASHRRTGQLRQPKPGTLPNAVRHFWQPIAGAVVVGALLLGNWWQYQSQQELKKTVQTLTATVEQLRNTNAPADSGQVGIAPSRNTGGPLLPPSLQRVIFPATEKRPADTVYITRYVTALPSAGQNPGYLTPNKRADGTTGSRLAQPGSSVQSYDNQATGAQNNRTTGQRLPNAVDAMTGRLTRESDNRNPAGRNSSVRIARQRRLFPTIHNAELARESAITDAPLPNSAIGSDATGTTTPALTDQLNMADLSPAERRQLKRLLRRTTSRRNATEQLTNGRAQVVTDPTSPQNRPDETVAKEKARITALLRANNLIAPSPFDSGYYDMDIARQLRRFRSPIAPNRMSETTPTDSPVKSSPTMPNGRFRLGIGGHLGYRQQGTGLYAEGLVGSKWAIGAGLTVQSLTGQTFLTDDDFDRKTDKDFRREFAPGIDPNHSILNITRRSTVWQIPVSVGYRVSLGQNWLVVPTATFNLNVWNQENVGFSYLRGPKMPPEQRTVLLFYDQRHYHSAGFSVNFEKQWALSGKTALVVQGGPYLTVPTSSVSPVSSLNALSGGVRLRTFLQF